MSDIKSAWEIAQEKANKLGELSPQEREGQRQDRCRLIGESLAEKYLSHHDISFLKEELSKQATQDKDLVSKAAMRRLIQAIDIRYPPTLAEISKGILTLDNSATAIKIMDEVKELFQEYTEAEDKERQETEKTGGEMLHQLRISGTAVSRLNIRAKDEWQKKLDQTAHPFDDRLNYLKEEFQHSR
jgi:cell division protein ZapA (FtsZ GTPase activity inhibitor)